LRIARISTRTKRHRAVLAVELLLSTKLGRTTRRGPLLRLTTPRSPIRMESLMVGTRASDAAVLHWVKCMTAGVRVRVRRRRARRLETKMRRHHPAGWESPVLLCGAGASALAGKVRDAGHGAELLLGRVEHHLLERPLRQLLLLLVGGLARKEAMLAKRGLLGKVRVAVERTWRRAGRRVRPLELLGMRILRGERVLAGRSEGLAGEGALASRSGHAGRVHRVLREREGHGWRYEKTRLTGCHYGVPARGVVDRREGQRSETDAGD